MNGCIEPKAIIIQRLHLEILREEVGIVIPFLWAPNVSLRWDPLESQAFRCHGILWARKRYVRPSAPKVPSNTSLKTSGNVNVKGPT